MGRILLQTDKLSLDVTTTPTTSNGFISDREILKKRSKKYLDLIAQLDAKTLTETQGVEALIENIKQEFGTADLASLPMGIVSKCYLGHPYEVHTLDLVAKCIITHYKISEAMEPDFEKARTVALHNAYAMVEIYKDKLILIRQDGTASKL